MPNWCENKLTVLGSKEEIEQIKSKLFRQNIESDELSLDFNLVAPIPRELKEGIYWCGRNWGTKWNATTCSVDIEDEKITCFFDTAWNPPLAWFRTLCQKFSQYEIEFYYYEPGWEFAGSLANSNGDFYYTRELNSDNDIKEFAYETFGICFDDEDDK
ncbi:hypothetical protein [Phocoenobacter skyensis]|uniref:DUF1281 family ferredoxin-like fold protein n=1 Tax=Phocoenobacter skyensis TaxID=97481 RepID=UPI002752D4DB|nr:hypothetical protein [Pasteurella skyensis]MDP8185351.1 hypothetical protein [Pasteurella skyensis]